MKYLVKTKLVSSTESSMQKVFSDAAKEGYELERIVPFGAKADYLLIVFSKEH